MRTNYCPDGSIEIGSGSNLSCYLCSSLSQFCLSCNPINNSFTCAACASVSYLSANNSVNNNCILCSSTLNNCLKCSSSLTCTNCVYPYTLLNNTCVSIPCIVINCQVCFFTNSSVCQTCASRFNLNSSTQHCDVTQCTKGFILLAGSCICPPMTMLNRNTYVSCSVYCATCDNFGCLTCKIGYYLADYFCLPCIPKCVACSSNRCTQCLNGFNLQNDGGSCLSIGGINIIKLNNKFFPYDLGC
jgi:hypothetical protein